MEGEDGEARRVVLLFGFLLDTALALLVPLVVALSPLVLVVLDESFLDGGLVEADCPLEEGGEVDERPFLLPFLVLVCLTVLDSLVVTLLASSANAVDLETLIWATDSSAEGERRFFLLLDLVVVVLGFIFFFLGFVLVWHTSDAVAVGLELVVEVVVEVVVVRVSVIGTAISSSLVVQEEE